MCIWNAECLSVCACVHYVFFAEVIGRNHVFECVSGLRYQVGICMAYQICDKSDVMVILVCQVFCVVMDVCVCEHSKFWF